MKKLQNSFKEFLPIKYLDFRRGAHLLSANKAVVAELLRICCEENDVKAIKVAFERILGKPEKVIIIKRTLVKTVYPDARTKATNPIIETRVQDETQVAVSIDERVVISEDDAPGRMLTKMLDDIGEKGREYAYEVIDKKDQFSVIEVMVANLYAIAMRGANLAAIMLLFDYLDGAVADVVRIDGEDTIMIDNYSDIAPYEAVQDERSIWYVETEAIH